MASIFERLGEIITSRPWVFIAVWAVILVVSLPLVLTFMSHLQYDTQKFIPDSLGANLATNAYDAQFPSNASNQILVVVSATNNTTSMHFIDALDTAIANDKNITNVTGTSSIYNIQREAVVNMTPDLYNNLYAAFDNVSNGSQQLYNATDVVINTSNSLYWLYDNITTTNSQLYQGLRQVQGSSAQLYSARDQIVQVNGGLYQVKGSIDVLIGIPSFFAQAYNGTDSSLDGANRTSLTIGETQAFIQSNVPAANQQLAFGYLLAFDAAWNTTNNANPYARAQEAITSIGPGFVSQNVLSGEQPLMLNIVNNFALSSYPGGERDFCVNSVAATQNITDVSEKQQLYAAYDLGSSPSEAAIDNLVISTAASQGGVSQSSIAVIYNMGRNPSDGTVGNYLVNQAITGLESSASGENMSASDLQNATDLIQDAWNMGGTATEQDFNSYVLNKAGNGQNASENQTIAEIYGWGPDPNATVVQDYVLQQAGNGQNASGNQTLAQIYDLGRNPGNDTIKNYVITQALSGMNLTTNTSFFFALLGLNRNLTDDQLKTFATAWEYNHSYDDPQILPGSVVNSLASGNLTLYVVSTSDGEAAQASVDMVQQIRDHITQLVNSGQYPGVQAYVTGATAMAVDSKAATNADVGNIDKITIPLVLILLFLYFRSYITPLVPLIIIGIAVVACFGLMGVISLYMDIYYLVETFMVVIMLGAGTDYCVFMLSRYSEERSNGNDVKGSVKMTVTHAGKSIASSGSTAIIGFMSLMLIPSGIFQSIGIGTAASILMSMLVALTLVPAILTIAGDRLFWPRKLHNSGPSRTGKIWGHITGKAIKHPIVIITIALLVTVPAVVIFDHLQLGNDTVSMLPNGQESKVGYNLMDSQFGSGAIDRAMVVATLPTDIKDTSGNFSPGALGRIENLSSELAAVPGVADVYSTTRPEGSTINYDNLSAYGQTDSEYYQSYMNNSTGNDDRTTVLYVAFNGSPYSDQSQHAIDTIQATLNQYNVTNPGTTLLLGGTCVGLYEYQKLCMGNYVLVIPVVLIGIFIILMLLLRSVFTPARLIMTLLMSISWTMAALILVFQDWLQNSIFWILPIILFCVLMGLGVDYDIFLVTRIREEVMKGKTDEQAIADAVESVGTIIMLCGLVMASAFGSMMISNMMMMKEFGFVLCLAIFLDATLMRLIVVPSIMVLMKKYNWWMPLVKNEVEKARLEAAPIAQKQDK
jgi:RND superfamily putative drug exporter